MNACERAMTIIANTGEATRDEAARPAFAHLVGCGRCMRRLDQLARAALSDEPVELSCAECRGRLPALRDALAGAREPAVEARAILSAEALPPGELAEAPPLARLAAAVAHLRRCPDCAWELRALDEVLSLHEAGALAEAPAGLALDLGFLDGLIEASAERRTLMPEVGEAAAARSASDTTASPPIWKMLPERAGLRPRRLAAALRLVVRESDARFGELARSLEPRPLAGGVFRDLALDEAAVGERLSLPDEGSGLRIQLSVGPAQNARAVIGLTLSRTESREPLADTRVLLYDDAARLLAGEMTRPDGSAYFQDLAAGAYLLEVRLGEDRWQLPLVVSEG